MTNEKPKPKAKRWTRTADRKAKTKPFKLHPDEQTLATIKGLAAIQATTRECAAVLRVSEPTFLSFKAAFPEVRDAIEQGTQEGLASLRRRQFKLAETNAAMAIFLGKNYLGQKDERQHTGKDGGPIQTVDLTGLTNAELDRFEQILTKLATASDGDAPAPAGREGTTTH